MEVSVTCGEIFSWLEQMAPLDSAEPWDNPGMQVGYAGQPVEKVLLALDVTSEVVDEALAKKVQLIICHHPMLFRPMKQLRTDAPDGSLLARLIRGDISVYAAHTNLDIAPGGVNDALASRLGLLAVKPLREKRDDLVKIVVFVPTSHAEKVWGAMAEAGAGFIGNYSHCSFQVPGKGTFRPLTGARPFSGEIEKISTEDEIRIETVVPLRSSASVLRAMFLHHPYEEVAYDVLPLKNNLIRGGLGRIGDLPQAMQLSDFAEFVKSALDGSCLRVVGETGSQVRKVAVCGGAGADLIGDAARSGADALVTGDVKYHDAQSALEHGVCVVDAGHYATEFPVLNTLKQQMEKQSGAAGWGCAIEISENQRDVFAFLLQKNK
jgi:dinuclear metal center YbgI/SA1388 family protein